MTPSILVYTTLFPNAAQPTHGIFVENRLRDVVRSGAARAVVVAPVPFFPFARGFGHWSIYARVPRVEQRHGVTIHHPRYPVIPRVGMSLAPVLLRRATLPLVHRLARAHAIDLIDAHYFYPDGVAAVAIGRALGLPVVVTARGTDLTLIPSYPGPARQLRAAIAAADATVTVSASLAVPLRALGADPTHLRVLRNGIHLDLFRPVPRDAARASLSLTGPTLLSVGHLIERKGHHRVIEALTHLPGVTLLIVGEGPDHASLTTLAARLGLAARVRLLGPRPHEDLPALYTAADITVLASSREGWANVLLESLACGTPVVASNAGGNAEVIAAPEAGLIVPENTPETLADAIGKLLAAPPDRALTRAYAELFGWAETTRGQAELFTDVLRRRGHGPA